MEKYDEFNDNAEEEDSSNHDVFLSYLRDQKMKSEEGWSSSSLLKINESSAYTLDDIVYSRSEIACLELASIINEINAPYHVYERIFKWAERLQPDDLSRISAIKL